MTTLAEQVAEVKDGEYLRVEFDYGRTKAVFTGPADVWQTSVKVGYQTIRYMNGSIDSNLTSITRVPRPIPSEPEVGSFALLDGELQWAQKPLLTLTEKSYCWSKVNVSDNIVEWFTWPEIYPHIIKLYTPSGELVTGFEYAGEETK